VLKGRGRAAAALDRHAIRIRTDRRRLSSTALASGRSSPVGSFCKQEESLGSVWSLRWCFAYTKRAPRPRRPGVSMWCRRRERV